MTTVAEGLRRTAEGLAARGVPNAEFEARELVSRTANFPRDAFPARLRDTLPAPADGVLTLFARQRAAGIPLAHLLGEWDFLDFTVTVTPDVLVPRPETEQLFELARRELPAGAGTPLRLGDCGTGSGVLALAMARRWPGASVAATDVSRAALAVARWNARRLGLEGRIDWREGDLLATFAGAGFDAVLANLPYVTEAEWPALAPEVRREPRGALVSGPDGLSALRRFAPMAFRALRSGGTVFLEVGRGQAARVSGFLENAGFSKARVEKDLAGIERFVWAARP